MFFAIKSAILCFVTAPNSAKCSTTCAREYVLTSIATESAPAKGKKPRKAAAGQKEMLPPIEGSTGQRKGRQTRALNRAPEGWIAEHDLARGLSLTDKRE